MAVTLLIKELELNAFHTQGIVVVAAPEDGFLIYRYAFLIEGGSMETFSCVLMFF